MRLVLMKWGGYIYIYIYIYIGYSMYIVHVLYEGVHSMYIWNSDDDGSLMKNDDMITNDNFHENDNIYILYIYI